MNQYNVKDIKYKKYKKLRESELKTFFQMNQILNPKKNQ